MKYFKEHYLEDRKKIDAILDAIDEKDIFESLEKHKTWGKMGLVANYLAGEYAEADNRVKVRESRIERLKSINAPEIILVNEDRVLCEQISRRDTIEETYKDIKCAQIIDDSATNTDFYIAMETAKDRGCNDCAFRCSKNDSYRHTNDDTDCFCCLHVKHSKEEVEEICSTKHCKIEDGKSIDIPEEEVRKQTETEDRMERWAKPCDKYIPVTFPPLFYAILMKNDNHLARIKEKIKDVPEDYSRISLAENYVAYTNFEKACKFYSDLAAQLEAFEEGIDDADGEVEDDIQEGNTPNIEA